MSWDRWSKERWTRRSSNGAARRTIKTPDCTRPSTSTSGPSDFRPEEPPQDRFDRLLHRVAQYGLARPEVVPLWASLLSLPIPDRFPPLPLPPARQREETFRLMLEWLHVRPPAGRSSLSSRICTGWTRPRWNSWGSSSPSFLHDRILTLLTFRPEFKPPWAAVDHQTSLSLNRLTRRQVGDLMRKKAGTPLPEAVIEQVYDRAGGVPLFVEEFTKMVQEAGVPDQAGDRGFRPTLPVTRFPARSKIW